MLLTVCPCARWPKRPSGEAVNGGGVRKRCLLGAGGAGHSWPRGAGEEQRRPCPAGWRPTVAPGSSGSLLKLLLLPAKMRPPGTGGCGGLRLRCFLPRGFLWQGPHSCWEEICMVDPGPAPATFQAALGWHLPGRLSLGLACCTFSSPWIR